MALGLAALVSGAPLASVSPQASTAPAEVEQAYASVVLKIGDQKYKHPGFFAYMDEESVFNFDIGGKVHEVAVAITGGEKKGYDLNVVYKVGARLVLDGSGHIDPGKKLKVNKGKVSLEVVVDPHGQVDKKRKKKIGGPGSEDPLG
jgi:hypothetical protein